MLPAYAIGQGIWGIDIVEIKFQAWRKLENSEGATSAERRFHGGETPEKNLDFRANIVKMSNSE